MPRSLVAEGRASTNNQDAYKEMHQARIHLCAKVV
jgi:hypothetical protein